MRQHRCILFDLDGTLTDPGEGIIKSLIFALEHYDIQGDPAILRKFIGPPLMDSFQRYYDFNEDQANEAITFYRKRFHEKGVFENYVYPGIPELLQSLVAAGKQLAIATTKPTVYALQVLKHFNIHTYFEEELLLKLLDGRRTDKAEIISVLERLGNESGTTLMVGDRKFDIIGAKANNIPVIGITYGYGEREELEKPAPT